MRRYRRQSTSKNILLLKTSPYIPISASNHIPYGHRRGRRRPAMWVGLPLCDLSITIWRRCRFSSHQLANKSHLYL